MVFYKYVAPTALRAKEGGNAFEINPGGMVGSTGNSILAVS